MKIVKNIIGVSCLAINSFGASLDNLSEEVLSNLIEKVGDFSTSSGYKTTFRCFITHYEIENFYGFLENENAFSSQENFYNELKNAWQDTKAGKNILELLGLESSENGNNDSVSLDNLPENVAAALIEKIDEFAANDEYMDVFVEFITENEIEAFYEFLGNTDAFASEQNFGNELMNVCGNTQLGQTLITRFFSREERLANETIVSEIPSNIVPFQDDFIDDNEIFTEGNCIDTPVSLFDNNDTREQFKNLVNNLQELNDRNKDNPQGVHQLSKFLVENMSFISELFSQVLRYFNDKGWTVSGEDSTDWLLSLEIDNDIKGKFLEAISTPLDKETKSSPMVLFQDAYRLSKLIENLSFPIESDDAQKYNLTELERNIKENYETQGGCIPGICNRLKGHICKCLVWFYNHTQALKRM